MAQEEDLSARFPLLKRLQMDEALMDRSGNDLPQEPERTSQTGGRGDNQELEPGTFPKPGEGALSIQLKVPGSPGGVYSFQLRRSQLKYHSAIETLCTGCDKGGSCSGKLVDISLACLHTSTALQKETCSLLHAEVLQSYLKERGFSGHPCNLLADTSPCCSVDFSAEERLAGELRCLAVPL